MGKVIAAITTSVDGYIVGPKDGPEHGLGIGGERLHYWVMGGPWTYADDGHDTDGMHGADREYYESLTDGIGCGIVGRNMYDAAPVRFPQDTGLALLPTGHAEARRAVSSRPSRVRSRIRSEHERGKAL
jgi:dihydrofolate reductase